LDHNMKYEWGSDVEFVKTCACRVLSPDDEGLPRTLVVKSGARGCVDINPELYDTLPGEVPVRLKHPAYPYGRVTLMAHEGSIVPYDIDHDPETGEAVAVVYRGLRVPIDRSRENEDG
jgi:hypothetical protein